MMNVLLALDQNGVADLEEVRAEAADALEKYVAARTRMAELEAAIDLRRAMGASVRDLKEPVLAVIPPAADKKKERDA
jgi:hypothetical protein